MNEGGNIARQSNGLKSMTKLPSGKLKPTLIEKYSFGSKVSKMRKRGMSYIAIARELNNTEADKIKDGEMITSNHVMQYVQRNGIDDVLDEHKTMEIVNTYNEHKRLLNILERQMDMVIVFLDDIQRQCYTTGDVSELYTRIRELSVDLEKYVARKQSILTQMQAIQDKIYNTESLSIIIKEMLDIIKRRDPQMYDDVIAEMRNSKIILANYQKIKDDSQIFV